MRLPRFNAGVSNTPNDEGPLSQLAAKTTKVNLKTSSIHATTLQIQAMLKC